MNAPRWIVRTTAGILIGAVAALAHSDDVSDAKRLLRSKNPDDRARAIELLVRADAKRSVQPLEDAIRRSRKDMGRLAKEVDEFDVLWMDALNYYRWARDKGDVELANMLARSVKHAEQAWHTAADEARGHLAVLTTAGQSMARFRSPGAVRQIDKGARQERDAWIRQMYVVALARSRRAESVPTLLKLLEHRDPRVRAVAALSLRPFILRKPVIDALQALDDDKNWSTRLHAYETIARAPLDVAVPYLIERVQAEDGQMAASVDALLLSLTGQSFADSPASWSMWWKDNAGRVRDGSFEPDPPRGSDKNNTVASFFSIPIVSKNVLFVVDYSGSMEEEMSLPGAWANDLREKYRLPATRLGYAQTELIRAIKGLPDDARFNIVLYDDKARRFAKKSAKASFSTRKRAIKWALSQETGWMTNFWDALRVAFGDHLEGAGGVNVFRDLPDTIVFLSDGTPTRGRFQDAPSLALLVKHWNLASNTIVHTIGIGADHERELLLELAATTHGSYLDLSMGESGLVTHRRLVPGDERGPHIGRLLAQAQEGLASDEYEDRIRALGKIKRLGPWGFKAVGPTAAALADLDGDVQEAAVKALASIGPNAIESILPYLENEDMSVVVCALRVFGALGSEGTAAIPAIVPLLKHDDDDIQHAAIEALGWMGAAAKEARPQLESICQTEDEETKRLAKQALERIDR